MTIQENFLKLNDWYIQYKDIESFTVIVKKPFRSRRFNPHTERYLIAEKYPKGSITVRICTRAGQTSEGTYKQTLPVHSHMYIKEGLIKQLQDKIVPKTLQIR